MILVLGNQPAGDITHLCATCAYLSSCSMSLPLGQYQIILLSTDAKTGKVTLGQFIAY